MSTELSKVKIDTESTVHVGPRHHTYGSPRSHNSSNSPAKQAAKNVLNLEDHSLLNLNSASTLQHHSASYKFPQSERFPPIKTYGPHCYSGSPSSMAKNGTTMGYGGKIDVVNYTNKDAQLFPSPDRYHIRSDFDAIVLKGKTESDRRTSSKSPEHSVTFKSPKNIPGPGAYNLQKDILSEVTSISMKPRGKMFNEGLGLDSPKCNQYSPSTNLVMPTKHASPGFGYGQKYDFTKPKNNNPGPGAYQPANMSYGPTKKDVTDKISGAHY